MMNPATQKNFNILKLLPLPFFFLFLQLIPSLCQAQNQAAADYPSLIKQADQALATKDFASAVFLYEKANRLKPEQKYASGKIAGINRMLDTLPALRAEIVENLILKAEDFYKQKNYPSAKTEYQKALLFDPSAQFPKDRLSQISTVYTDPTDASFFAEAMGNGDKAFAASDFEKAIQSYETALSVKPDSKAAKDKIAAAKKSQAESKVRNDQAAKLIASADKLLQTEKRPEAKAEYQKALELTPENAYVKEKIAEIDKFFADKKALQDVYDKAIEQADQLYINRDFVNARLKYQEALKVKPEARYPKEMLEKTKSGESQLLTMQEIYDAALANAENLLKNSDLEAAMNGFKSASDIKPDENYPKTKITEIEKLITERNNRKAAFELAIKNGDQALSEKNYEQSLKYFKEAQSLQPGDKYPTAKIEEINVLTGQIKALNENFAKLVSNGDKSFNLGRFSEAIVSYNNALELKPAESYPQQKIAEAQQQLSALQSKEENYKTAITLGDSLLAKQNFAEALDAYKQALTIKPSEKYPKDKSDEINKILAKQKSDNDSYTLAITNGDKALASANYNQALTSYQDALKIKPSEKYPQDKIDEIKALQATQQLTNEKYSAAIATADQLFAEKEYGKALVSYTEATGLKINEKYPSAQIAKINQLLSDLKSADENYRLAISHGDSTFAINKFPDAKAFYNKALTIKPSETYPKTQIEKINVLVAEQKKLDDNYLSALASADKLFGEKKYEESVTGYRSSLALKPEEKYPSEKIAEAEKLIADLKAIQEAYDKAVAEGDKRLSEKDYENALVSFKNAVSAKPTEPYPNTKITEIQAILDKNKAEGQRYQEAIAQADKFFTDLKYREALEPYQRASTIKPAEKYPQEQISRINQLLAEQKKMDEDYQKLIADADISLKASKFEEAKTLYTNASTLKPSEKLPKDKIVEIDGILADIRNKEENFAKAVTEGDAFFSDKKYQEASVSYNKALTIKPTETYPKTQIEKINLLVAEQKKLDDNYLSALASADKLFGEKKYEESVTGYRSSLALKPEEKYPSEKIAEAEKLIADLKAIQEDYDKAVAEGDKHLSEKDYENAMVSYKNAKSAKPTEPYPNTKITEIQAILDKNKAEGQRYQEAIAQADKFFTDLKYREALEPYQRASTIKPAEKYPQEQISRINQLLVEQKKLDEDYQKLLTDADISLKAGKFEEAKTLYSNASTLKPAEKLPKDKIAEIDGILTNLKLKDENYTKAINAASESYSSKDLKAAVKLYEDALAIKPAEKFPQERIVTIKAELKAIDDNYSEALNRGDGKLAAKNLMEALNAYQNALEIKPSEEYPKSKIAEINATLAAQKEEQEKMYASFISEGDKLFNTKDYSGAKSAFTKATGIKPAEDYPKQRLTAINTLMEEIENARKAEFNKAIGEADNLYNTKIFDQAIDAYEKAGKINPGDPYPEVQIGKIRKYMTDHAIQDLYSQAFQINEGNEKKFTFTEIEPRLRKNNYILIKARSTGKTAPKVYLNYGRGEQKNGGIVLRNLEKTTISDYLIRISVQDKWYREDNNWISLFVESGDIEIVKLQIAAGD